MLGARARQSFGAPIFVRQHHEALLDLVGAETEPENYFSFTVGLPVKSEFSISGVCKGRPPVSKTTAKAETGKSMANMNIFGAEDGRKKIVTIARMMLTKSNAPPSAFAVLDP